MVPSEFILSPSAASGFAASGSAITDRELHGRKRLKSSGSSAYGVFRCEVFKVSICFRATGH